ncbi:hypothetical protein PBI_SCTP2_61 [Salicola phage SCTP-2]|nr:hypothetical protein PBI_SCTP2_61 [Salicola phage SCTP-2]
MINMIYKFSALFYNIFINQYIMNNFFIRESNYIRRNFLKHIPQKIIPYIDKKTLLEAVTFYYNNLNRYSDKLPYDYIEDIIVYYNTPFVISYIHNDNEPLQLLAVQKSPINLFLIDNSTENVIFNALTKRWKQCFYNEVKQRFNLSDNINKKINREKLMKGPMEEEQFSYNTYSKGTERGTQERISIESL